MQFEHLPFSNASDLIPSNTSGAFCPQNYANAQNVLFFFSNFFKIENKVESVETEWGSMNIIIFFLFNFIFVSLCMCWSVRLRASQSSRHSHNANERDGNREACGLANWNRNESQSGCVQWCAPTMNLSCLRMNQKIKWQTRFICPEKSIGRQCDARIFSVLLVNSSIALLVDGFEFSVCAIVHGTGFGLGFGFDFLALLINALVLDRSIFLGC